MLCGYVVKARAEKFRPLIDVLGGMEWVYYKKMGGKWRFSRNGNRMVEIIRIYFTSKMGIEKEV